MLWGVQLQKSERREPGLFFRMVENINFMSSRRLVTEWGVSEQRVIATQIMLVSRMLKDGSRCILISEGHPKFLLLRNIREISMGSNLGQRLGTIVLKSAWKPKRRRSVGNRAMPTLCPRHYDPPGVLRLTATR